MVLITNFDLSFHKIIIQNALYYRFYTRDFPFTDIVKINYFVSYFSFPGSGHDNLQQHFAELAHILDNEFYLWF